MKGGVRVAVGDLEAGEIVTAPGKGGLGPQVVPFEPGFQGGVFVVAGN